MTPEQMALLHAAAFAPERGWSAEEFADLLNVPGGFAVTAETGFALGRAIAGEAELLTLVVDPSARRQGTGRQLLERFLAEAAARGAETAFLEVAEDNQAARRLYLVNGFTETGRRPGYYARPSASAADAVTMSRRLDAAEG